MIQPILKSSESLAFAYATNSTGVKVQGAKTVAIVAQVTNSAPSAGAFTADASTDVCTKASHGFLTGLKIQVSTSSALPAGLSASTDYFVIKVTASTFKLATSLVNAQAGTAIDITDAGTGTQTITPTSLAGASFKVQGSLDDEDVAEASKVYADLPIQASGDATKTGTITATANFFLKDVDPAYKFVRIAYTLTAGQLAVTQTTLVQG